MEEQMVMNEDDFKISMNIPRDTWARKLLYNIEYSEKTGPIYKAFCLFFVLAFLIFYFMVDFGRELSLVVPVTGAYILIASPFLFFKRRKVEKFLTILYYLMGILLFWESMAILPDNAMRIKFMTMLTDSLLRDSVPAEYLVRIKYLYIYLYCFFCFSTFFVISNNLFYCFSYVSFLDKRSVEKKIISENKNLLIKILFLVCFFVFSSFFISEMNTAVFYFSFFSVPFVSIFIIFYYLVLFIQKLALKGSAHV